jgi:hypothetical protein
MSTIEPNKREEIQVFDDKEGTPDFWRGFCFSMPERIVL